MGSGPSSGGGAGVYPPGAAHRGASQGSDPAALLRSGLVAAGPAACTDYPQYHQVQGYPPSYAGESTQLASHSGQIFEPQPARRGCGLIVPLAVAAVVLAVIAAAGVVLWTPGAYERLQASLFPPPPAPQWALDTLPDISDKHHLERGREGNPYRQKVEDLFQGTHVQGYAPGHAAGQDIVIDFAGHKIEGKFGPIVLSPKAAALEQAMQQEGWQHRRLYHGTENPFVDSILSGGFYHSDGMHGVGIYATRTFSHAQCYAPGDGESILELAVYWNPANQSRYFNHVPHNSLINDVYVIRDPLLVMPKEVLRCCPEELTCR